MSNIHENLQKILHAVWGKDVRQAIHDAIHDCYEDGSAGSTDLIAREEIEELEATKATRIELAEETADRLAEVAVERGRIDNLVTSGTGVTNATKRTETTLFSASVPCFGNVSGTSGYFNLEDAIENYDYIKIRYSAFGKTGIVECKPSDIPATGTVGSTVFHWSEIQPNYEVISLENPRSVFRHMDFYSYNVSSGNTHRLSIDAVVFGWNGDATSNGKISDSFAISWDSSKSLYVASGFAGGIYSIIGVKYTDAGVDKDTELTDIRTGADGTVYQTAGGAVRGQIEDITNRLNGVESNFGDEYDSTATYAVGDRRVHKGVWYECNTPINTAEDWTEAHWDKVSLADITDQVAQNTADIAENASDIQDLKEDLNALDEKQSMSVLTSVTAGWVSSKYLNVNFPIGTEIGNKVVSTPNYRYIQLPVEKGDTYILSGTGGGDARLYAWLDTDHKLLYKSDASLTVTNETLTAQQNGYLIVNANKNYDYSLQREHTIVATASGYSLSDFGAVGDGTTDDTDAIQTALNYCKDVYIPSGTYVFSNTLYVKSGTTLHGDGGASVLQLADSFTLTPYTWREDSELVADHNRYPMIMIETTESGCMLSNFKLRGQIDHFYDKNCEGISVFGSNHVLDNLVVEKINFFPSDFSGRVNNGVGYGIRIAGTTVTVRNCTVNECGYEGIGLEDADTVTVEGCNVGYSLQTGLQIHRNCQHIHIVNNTIICFNGNATYRPGITLHAIAPYVLRDINISGNYIVSSIMVANGGSENDVRVCNNFLTGINVNDFNETDNRYREKWVIIGNTITQSVRAKCDKILIANNIFTLNGTNIIYVKSNKCLAENNLAAGSAQGVVIEPH